jgi:hypothetical protein
MSAFGRISPQKIFFSKSPSSQQFFLAKEMCETVEMAEKSHFFNFDTFLRNVRILVIVRLRRPQDMWYPQS